MDYVLEQDELVKNLQFFDDNGVGVVPVSATYEVTDVGSGTVVRAATAVPGLAASVDLALLYADNTLVDSAATRERRRVKVVAIYEADNGEGDPRQRTTHFEYEVLRVPPVSWTSREELEDLFGATNVEKWANIENTASADSLVQRRVESACVWATADAIDRLRGRRAGSITIAPRALRLAVTRMAGCQLYEARGIKDTVDDAEGRHRLKYHRDLALQWYRALLAGQIRLEGLADDDITVIPKVVKSATRDCECAESLSCEDADVDWLCS
jgi:hypothetical protein